jgi:hypothetical protein
VPRTPGPGTSRDRCGGRSRSGGPGARQPVPLLRRTHDRHRDLRGRLPTTPQAERAPQGNPHRHLMRPITTSRTRTAKPLPRWSSTGYACAHPWPSRPTPSMPPSAPKSLPTAPQSTRVKPPAANNHPIPVPRRPPRTHCRRHQISSAQPIRLQPLWEVDRLCSSPIAALGTSLAPQDRASGALAFPMRATGSAASRSIGFLYKRSIHFLISSRIC